MSHFLYAAGLLLSIGGLLIIDWRTRLAFWHDAQRTLKTLLAAIALFIAWDFAGIAAAIFYHPRSAFDLPLTIVPEFPLEELLFLFLLCYVALLLYVGAIRRWPRT